MRQSGSSAVPRAHSMEDNSTETTGIIASRARTNFFKKSIGAAGLKSELSPFELSSVELCPMNGPVTIQACTVVARTYNLI